MECNKRTTVQRTYSGSHPAGCYLKEGIKYWNTATGSTNSQARRVCTQPAASVPAEKVLVDKKIDKDCRLGTCTRFIGYENAWKEDVGHCRNSTSAPTQSDTFAPTSQAEYSSLTPTLFPSHPPSTQAPTTPPPTMEPRKLLTDSNLMNAVRLYFSDKAHAIKLYGHINQWEMSSVQQINRLFFLSLNMSEGGGSTGKRGNLKRGQRQRNVSTRVSSVPS